MTLELDESVLFGFAGSLSPAMRAWLDANAPGRHEVEAGTLWFANFDRGELFDEEFGYELEQMAQEEALAAPR